MPSRRAAPAKPDYCGPQKFSTVNKKLRNCSRFVLLGARRAGAGALQEALTTNPDILSFGPVLHRDEEVRRTAHERLLPTSSRSWLLRAGSLEREGRISYVNPRHYISHVLWDEADRQQVLPFPDGHLSLGFLLHEEDADLWDIWDTLEESPEIRIIRVTRNPLACYVSLVQAETFNRWQCAAAEAAVPDTDRVFALHSDRVEEHLKQYMRLEARVTATERNRVNNRAQRMLTLEYRDLITNPSGVFEKVCNYLSVPYNTRMRFRTRKIDPRAVLERCNYSLSSALLPKDCQHFARSLII